MDLQDIRILAVDDEPANLGVLEEMLNEEGAEFWAATSGENAVAVVGEHRLDLVLLDVNMPGMDGFETCRQLRKMEHGVDLPVIFLTAQDTSESVVEGFTVGGSDYVTKPFDREALLARIKSQLRNSRLPRSRDEDAMEALLDSPELLDALMGTRLFQGIGEDELSPLISELKQVTLSGGNTLIRQGQYGSAIYILLSGRLQVSVSQDDGSEKPVAEIGRGEVVGEISALTGRGATANVAALRDSNLVQIPKGVIDRFKQGHVLVLQNLSQMLAERVGRGPRTRLDVPSSVGHTTIAVIPAHGDVPLSEFADTLADTLEGHGTVLHLDADAVDRHLGPGSAQAPEGGEGHRMVAGYLNRQEGGHRFVIYEADPTPSAWTARCLRHADRVLIVGCAWEDPIPSVIEAELEASGNTARRELVLLHSRDTERPSGTAEWLEGRDLAMHHHVRVEDAGHMRRLGRILAGRAVCLVLSGGVAHGYAHFGVIQAMEEAGIPVDVIGGNSAGAGVAAHYVLDQGRNEALALHEEWIIRRRSVQSYTLPLVSISNGRPYNQTMQAMFGNHRIEDAWTPFFCVSTNLTRASLHVHRVGPIWEGVRASTSMPGYFPPFVHDGDLLVDGGVIDNLPVNPMREILDGTVIASNVSSADTPIPYTDAFCDRSGFQLLWNRINPFARRIETPSMTEVIGRMMEVCRLSANPDDVLPDLEIRPSVGSYHSFDPKPYREIAEVGYNDARRQIETWRSDIPGFFASLEGSGREESS